jgi:putative membrane protein
MTNTAVRMITGLTAATLGLIIAALTPIAAFAAGPISAADRDFLGAVHSAASFAASASDLARTRASAEKIRTMGKKILAEDQKLDTLARTTATKLQSPIPSAPAPSLETLRAAKGEAFDLGYIDRLRSTAGDLLQLSATTRVNTRNNLVRDLAQRSTMAMATQLPMLESSGLVDFEALPAAAAPTTTTPTPAARGGPNADPSMLADARKRDGFLWPSTRVNLLVLGSAVLLAAIAGRWVLRGRRPRRSR